MRTQQITNEIIPALASHPGLRPPGVFVMLIRQHDQIEIFVGVDQRLGKQQREIRRHVLIESTVREQQVPLEVRGEILVRLAVVIAGAVRTALDRKSVV